MNNPRLAAEPENAMKIAVWYWKERVPEAAREDVLATTKAINGGTNGLADRKERYAEWQKTLTTEFLEKISDVRANVALPANLTKPANGPRVTVDRALRQQPEGLVDIRQVQDALNKLGYHDAHGRNLREDGHYGARTKEAVQAFQLAHGLKADGVVGPQTWGALKKSEQQPLLSDTRHPDHGLYKQALAGIERLPALSFRNQQERHNAAASVAFEAKVSGLRQIDHVVLSTNGTGLFAVQGALNDPAHQRIYIDKAQAAAHPLGKSTEQIDQERQGLQQQQWQSMDPGPRRHMMP